jgi:hypothetical protein
MLNHCELTGELCAMQLLLCAPSLNAKIGCDVESKIRGEVKDDGDGEETAEVQPYLLQGTDRL